MSTRPSNFGPVRILIVDDNRDAAESLARLLKTHNQIVEVCIDPWQAFAVMRRFRASVVLLDIAMPGINGYELARAIRQFEELKKVLLIAVTGYGMEEQTALEAGFNHQLVKPVDPAQVLKLINAASEK